MLLSTLLFVYEHSVDAISHRKTKEQASYNVSLPRLVCQTRKDRALISYPASHPTDSHSRKGFLMFPVLPMPITI